MHDIKIGVISTYPELSRLILQQAEKMKLGLDLKEGILEEGVTYARQFEKDGVDVIIGRGVTGKMIKKLVSLPVEIISITSFDILQALYRAKGLGRRVAYLGHRVQDFTQEFESITGMLGMDVDCYPYDSTCEMREQAEKIIRDKTNDVVVSTGLCVYEMAKKSGANVVLVQSGRDSVNRSIKRALEMVQNLRADQTRSKRFRSVLELAKDGILILDEKKTVSFINPSAEKLLGVEAGKVLGRDVDSLHEDHSLGPLFAGSSPVNEEYKDVGQKQLLVNSMPINIKNKDQGQVITFQSAEGIQVMENNLRRQIFKKGLVARYTFADLIGKSSLLKEAVKRARKFAAASATVLISGESGTGKELFAQSIHNESARKKHPFVAINCAAIPENLLESELFGYEEGAFTGAKKGGKLGLFEMAHGGTIFLDEIGEMSLVVQARLLRVLQEREIMRIGSDRVIPVDVRIIAATNYDLSMAVKKGKFRNDLYHRLEVLNLDLPPLRMRKDDIEILANHFIRQFGFSEKKEVPALSGAAIESLKNYNWPGNVRELQNIAQKYVLLIEDYQKPEHLVAKLIDEKIRNGQDGDNWGTITLRIRSMEEMEKEIIENLLSAGASTTEVSRLLGKSRTTLWRKTKSDTKNVSYGNW